MILKEAAAVENMITSPAEAGTPYLLNSIFTI